MDNENPRLAKEYQGGSQIDILKVLYDEFDLEELAYSMSENGYFDEEPIVVVPNNLPKSFKIEKYTDVNELQEALEELMRSQKIVFTVIEGNRRTATAKLLLDSNLRKKLEIEEDFPSPKDKATESDLKIIPAIFYTNRNEISPYLGVRHIAGILKWEAYAKAVYISYRIEEENRRFRNIDKSIKEIQRQIADRSDSIKRQYMCYKLVEQAENDLGFDTNEIKRRFSLITVALNSKSIRDYIGVASYKDVDFDKPLIGKKKYESLENLLIWIFGNGKGIEPILTDSRRITNTLAHVLSDSEATEYLIKFRNLQEAYERSGGEKVFLRKKINDAIRNIQNALNVAYKYKKEHDLKKSVEECLMAAEELNNVFRSK